MERRELLTAIAGVAALGTAGIDSAGADGDGGVREADTIRGSEDSSSTEGETVRVDIVLTGAD